jgi:hypothetical protein
VVPGENPESAGIDRAALVKAEFEAEVGNQIAVAQPRSVVPSQRLAVIGVVRREHPVEIAQIDRVGCRIEKLLLVDTLQEGLRTVADRLPQLGIEPRKELARRAVPAVPEVVGELIQPGKPRRDLRVDL